MVGRVSNQGSIQTEYSKNSYSKDKGAWPLLENQPLLENIRVDFAVNLFPGFMMNNEPQNITETKYQCL